MFLAFKTSFFRDAAYCVNRYNIIMQKGYLFEWLPHSFYFYTFIQKYLLLILFSFSVLLLICLVVPVLGLVLECILVSIPLYVPVNEINTDAKFV